MITSYYNIEMQQNSNVTLFEPFLKRENFAAIIEIGTRFGAFTRLIKDINYESEVYSYDIEDKKPLALSRKNINFFIQNIFDAEYANVVDTEALSILNSPYRKLILCDGGNKIKEFNCLAKHLKIGDVIMAHDYAPSIEYFDANIKGKIWNWCEITEPDIMQVSKDCGLVHYNQEEFQKAMWVCKVKVQ